MPVKTFTTHHQQNDCERLISTTVSQMKNKVLRSSLLSAVKLFKNLVDNILKDSKTVTENNLHALVQAFQNQPNAVYGNMTNQKTTDET